MYMIKYTQEKIDELLKNRNFIRLEPYTKLYIPILVKCLKDDYIWKMDIANFIYKNAGCPRCSGQEKWTNERIDNYLINKNLQIKRTGNIKNNKIELECLIDGYKWYKHFSNLVSGEYGCLKCSGSEKSSNEKLDNYLITNKIPLKRLGNYTTNKIKIKWECLIDGYKWSARPDCMMSKIKKTGTGCPKCGRLRSSNKNSKWNNDKIDNLLIKTNKGIKRNGDYIKSDIKIEWECLTEGHKWIAVPASIIYAKSGCPICKNKSENKINEKIVNIIKFNKFIRHKNFKFNNRRYCVDFYIENLNNKKIIIEYNGRQHYESINRFGGETQLLKQQKRDQELREYCSQNDITLLEIPYHMSDEDIIKELNILNTI